MFQLALATVGLILLADGFAAIGAGFTLKHYDAVVDLRAARAFLDNYSPFTPAGTIRAGLIPLGPAGLGHPPTTSLWFLPLARLDENLAAGAMTFFMVALFSVQVTHFAWLKRLPAPLLTSWMVIAFVMSCSFMRYHMNVGQISAAIGFFFYVAWVAARSGRDFEAGLALGAACTLKLFPGAVVLMFVLNRRWRVVAGAAAAYLLVAAIMTSRFGLASWPVFLSKQAAIADMWLGNIQNQSIHGVVTHLFFSPICRPTSPVIAKATMISSAISLILLALCGLLVWRTRALRHAFDLQFWLFVVAAIICSQWTWEHYSVIYVPAISILVCHLVERWRSGRRRLPTAAMAAGLVAIAASWRVDHMTKEGLQARYFHGDLSVHAKLHAYHVLNWAPGFLLLGLLALALKLLPRVPSPAAAPAEADVTSSP